MRTTGAPRAGGPGPSASDRAAEDRDARHLDRCTPAGTVISTPPKTATTLIVHHRGGQDRLARSSSTPPNMANAVTRSAPPSGPGAPPRRRSRPPGVAGTGPGAATSMPHAPPGATRPATPAGAAARRGQRARRRGDRHRRPRAGPVGRAAAGIRSAYVRARRRRPSAPRTRRRRAGPPHRPPAARRRIVHGRRRTPALSGPGPAPGRGARAARRHRRSGVPGCRGRQGRDGGRDRRRRSSGRRLAVGGPRVRGGGGRCLVTGSTRPRSDRLPRRGLGRSPRRRHRLTTWPTSPTPTCCRSGPDETPYRLVTTEGISTVEAAGRTFLRSSPRRCGCSPFEAVRDIQHLLRPGTCPAPRILDDPEAPPTTASSRSTCSRTPTSRPAACCPCARTPARRSSWASAASRC